MASLFKALSKKVILDKNLFKKCDYNSVRSCKTVVGLSDNSSQIGCSVAPPEKYLRAIAITLSTAAGSSIKS